MKNVDSLADQVWYHGILSREESDQLLEIDGDFLVRCSAINAKSDQYVLSCKWVSSNTRTNIDRLYRGNYNILKVALYNTHHSLFCRAMDIFNT